MQPKQAPTRFNPANALHRQPGAPPTPSLPSSCWPPSSTLRPRPTMVSTCAQNESCRRLTKVRLLSRLLTCRPIRPSLTDLHSLLHYNRDRTHPGPRRRCRHSLFHRRVSPPNAEIDAEGRCTNSGSARQILAGWSCCSLRPWLAREPYPQLLRRCEARQLHHFRFSRHRHVSCRSCAS